MIGDLSKQLFRGVWSFCSRHAERLVGSHQADPVPQATAMKPAEVNPHPSGGLLSEAWRRPVRLSTSRVDTDSEDFARNPVFGIWKQHKLRAHKWSHYFEAYDAIFRSRRGEAVRMLEIGVFQGASLTLWRHYFDNPEAIIVGIDIDPKCAQFESSHEKVHVRIGDQCDMDFLESVAREFGPFDIVLDDGSHFSSHIFASFNHLFGSALKDNGVYIVEDLHAHYWLPFRDTPKSFLDFCKELIEVMHAHYTRATLVDWFNEAESETHPVSLDVPAMATMIKEIRIFDSIVAIEKTRRVHLPRALNPKAS